jgi:hypothetical protein
MADESELIKQLMIVTIRANALREMVALLIAAIAKQFDNPDAIVQDIADALTSRVDVLLSLSPDVLSSTVEMAERTRIEEDWMIQQAQTWIRSGRPAGQTSPRIAPRKRPTPRKKPPGK